MRPNSASSESSDYREGIDANAANIYSSNQIQLNADRPRTNQNVRYNKAVAHNMILDQNNGVENETMQYQSCDESNYAQQINQLGGIMVDDQSNFEVVTVQANHYQHSMEG